MPWYRRSLQTWLGTVIGAGFDTVHARDVCHPHTGVALSLMLQARA